MKNDKRIFAVAMIAVLAAVSLSYADFVTATITAGTNPYAAAVNPVTNKTYVANYGSGTVTVINAANYYDTATITVGSNPRAIAINTLTNKIYVANFGGSSVSVIDGTTNAVTATISVPANPSAIAINPTTNMIYVTNYSVAKVTVISGSSNAIDTIPVGNGPIALCVNPVTNKIYVANSGSNNVTVINGATLATTTIVAGSTPYSIAANTVTNKIYLANNTGNSVTLIDGTTGSTATILVGTGPNSVAVNLETGKVYVSNSGSNNVTMIDSLNGATAITVGTTPSAVAVNTTTNKVYVTNYGSNTITVINGGTGRIDTTLAASSNPNSVAVNTITNKIYVGNAAGNNVTVIDGATNRNTAIISRLNPWAIAVNPLANKIYVTNETVIVGYDVKIIDCSTNDTFTIPNGTYYPDAVAVNPITNRIYIPFYGNATVMVIDGYTNQTTSVVTGSGGGSVIPYAVAVNPITNKIYVANYGIGTVAVIDGATTNNMTSVTVGSWPSAIDINQVTNKIYVANSNSGNVTVIDGATNVTTTVAAGTNPCAVAVNSVTNKIYVANENSANVTVIDGATNTTATVVAGTRPYAVAVNPVTNKIYVANRGSNNVTIIDGATNQTSTVTSGGIGPRAIAVNPVTNKVYVVNRGGGSPGNVTVIDDSSSSDTRLCTYFDGLPNNITISAQPTLTGKAVNHIRPSYTGIFATMNAMSTIHSSWSCATINSGIGTDSILWSWNWGSDTLLWGENYLCAYVLDSQATGTNNVGIGTSFTGNIAVYPIYRLAYVTLPEIPILVSPLNYAANQPTTVTFVWNKSAEASSYALQVAADSGFSSVIVTRSFLSDTLQTISGLAVANTYYWRVRAYNSAGASPWSTIWRFSTNVVLADIPTLIYPANGSLGILNNPILSWYSSSGAASYSVQVSTAVDFSSLFANDSTITDTTHTIYDLTPFVLYYWRVNAANPAGTSAWSTAWNFMTTSAPSLVSPDSGSVNQPVSCSFVWKKVGSATHYHIQVVTDTGFINIFAEDSLCTDSIKIINGCALNTKYYWRVKAKNANGFSAWSVVWNFTIGTSGVLSSGSSLPREFSVSGFSGTLHYALPVQCHVSLKYYDLRGRLIASFINQTQSPGYYSFHIDKAFNLHGTLIQVFEAGSFVKHDVMVMTGK